MTFLIVDDHQLFAEGLVLLVSNLDIVDKIEYVNSGIKAIDYCRKHTVHIIFMDIEMPLLDGIETTHSIKKEFQHTKIIGVTMSNDYNTIKKALKAGMDACILKNLGLAELENALSSVLNNEIYTSPEITKIMMMGLAGKSTTSINSISLSPREKDVTKLILEGLTDEKIANALFLSIHTIHTHRKNILSKLNLKNTAMLVKYISDNPRILN